MSEKKRLFTRMNPNTCPKCGKNSLWLVEYECTFNKLNEFGFIVQSDVEHHHMKLQCAECGAEYEKGSHGGMRYQIKSDLPKVNKIMVDYNPFQS